MFLRHKTRRKDGKEHRSSRRNRLKLRAVPT